jgi:hypothetical protein
MARTLLRDAVSPVQWKRVKLSVSLEDSSSSSGEEDDNSAEESCRSEDADDDVTLGLNDGIL